MYSAIHKEYIAAQNRQKILIGYKRQAIYVRGNYLFRTDGLFLSVLPFQAYSNQRRLNAELKELYAKLNVFREQVDAWSKVVGEFNKSLKELGDVENWAARMEREALILDGCLRLALTHSTPETVFRQPNTQSPAISHP
ncbi:unnamed protein product [Echinostoma caproni]|uniref:Biogenesis of lysosome-related organelles complex 1 subunit 1 n=1 Tax=Echinostoma caproni TaxID=27848 RepID=A0A183AJ83_9TREM|nr:unnamed protein product [Echinostoma caproni]